MLKAKMMEHGPGNELTSISFSIHRLTSRYPGSDIVGVPASETSVILNPNFKSPTSRARRYSSLNLWQLIKTPLPFRSFAILILFFK